jgi:hypothetical protein
LIKTTSIFSKATGGTCAWLKARHEVHNMHKILHKNARKTRIAGSKFE